MTRVLIPLFLLLVLLPLSFPRSGAPEAATLPDLVLHEFPDAGRAITLRHDFGLVIRNDGSFDEPVPVLFLAQRIPQSVVECRTHAELAAALDRLPSGVEWVRYEKCQVPLSAGISDAWLEGAMALFAERGQRVTLDEFVVCTCP